MTGAGLLAHFGRVETSSEDIYTTLIKGRLDFRRLLNSVLARYPDTVFLNQVPIQSQY